MGIFYNLNEPAGHVGGGRQPYEGRKLCAALLVFVPVAADAPPPKPAPLDYGIFQPVDPPLQPQRKLPQEFIAAPAADDPPFNSRRELDLEPWRQPDPLPQAAPRTPQPFIAAADNPPPRLYWLNAVLGAWEPIDPPLQPQIKLVQPFVAVAADNPPTISRAIDYTLWQTPPPPIEPQRKLAQPFVAVAADDPPFNSRRELDLGPWAEFLPLPQVNAKLVQPGAEVPPVVEPPVSEGGQFTAGYFSRGKWHDLRKLIEAERAAEQKAAELKRSQAKATLQRAAAKTQAIVEEIQSGHGMPEIERLTALLTAAARADQLSGVLSRAKQAEHTANAILAELQDEDDVIMVLLI